MVCSVEPAAGVNVNVSDVMARVGSKPTKTSVMVDPLLVSVILLMVGAAAGITMVRVGAGTGVISVPPAFIVAVMVIVPATVPVWTDMLVSDTVWPALTVTVVVRPPVENWIFGSSAPLTGVKVSVSVMVTSTG